MYIAQSAVIRATESKREPIPIHLTSRKKILVHSASGMDSIAEVMSKTNGTDRVEKIIEQEEGNNVL